MTRMALKLGAATALAALGVTLATAAPAAAQDWRPAGGYGPGYGYGGSVFLGGPVFPGAGGGYRPQPVSYSGAGLRDREDRVQLWIDRARADGELPGWRAWHAQGDLNAIRRDERNLLVRQGALGPGQAAWLSGRLDHLTGYIRQRDGFGGYGGYRPW